MIHLDKKKLYAYGLPIVSVILIIVLSYSGYHYLQRTQSVARVSSTYIDSDTYTKRVENRQTFLQAQSQASNPDAVSQDILNLMIDEVLIEKYAKNNDIPVTQAEVDARYQQLADTYGEAELENRLEELYGPRGISNYSEVIRADILRDKVQDELTDTPLREWLENERSEAQIDIYRQ